jgi:hypothetical protein
VVAERLPLLEAARAHERLKRGGYAGKVVLITKDETGTNYRQVIGQAQQVRMPPPTF